MVKHIYNFSDYDEKLYQRYQYLKNQCPLDKNASYDEYIDWFIKKFGVYYTKYFVAFCFCLKDLRFPYTTCKIREDIEDKLINKKERNFYEIAFMIPYARLKYIDIMSGQQFETFLTWLFSELGFRVEKTKKGSDQGADLILNYKLTQIAVQVKRWGKKVGNKAVQEIYTAKSFYQCDDAWVVTNNYFTKQAEKLAQKCNVKLIDRKKLNNYIEMIHQQ